MESGVDARPKETLGESRVEANTRNLLDCSSCVRLFTNSQILFNDRFMIIFPFAPRITPFSTVVTESLLQPLPYTYS